MGTELSSEELTYLRDTEPTEERSDLVCPDCGAPLTLKLGKFGRFYGCSKWSETGCKGSHGASLTGAPLGVPANAKTRNLRRRVVRTIHILRDDDTLLHRLPEDFCYDKPVSAWDDATCVQFLRATEGEVTKWDLLNLDKDFLDLMGDIDPTV